MSTYTVTGPLRFCRCGHGEHTHREWLFECPEPGCRCGKYVRARGKRAPEFAYGWAWGDDDCRVTNPGMYL